MKQFFILLYVVCSWFSSGFSNPDGEDDYIRRKRVFDTACNCGYEYVYELDSERLLSINRLYQHTNIQHGISYSIGERGDTDLLSYYDMGQINPMQLSIKNKYFVSGILEIVDNIGVDSWRGHYPKIQFKLNENAAWIDYSFKDGKRIFSEQYDNGRRVERRIYDQRRFDRLKLAYYAVTGAQIFHANCTSCHRIDVDATGPSLKGVGKRHSKEWLRKWISNPARLIAEGDPEATKVYDTWHRTAMTCFPFDKPYMDKLINYLELL